MTDGQQAKQGTRTSGRGVDINDLPAKHLLDVGHSIETAVPGVGLLRLVCGDNHRDGVLGDGPLRVLVRLLNSPLIQDHLLDEGDLIAPVPCPAVKHYDVGLVLQLGSDGARNS